MAPRVVIVEPDLLLGLHIIHQGGELICEINSADGFAVYQKVRPANAEHMLSA